MLREIVFDTETTGLNATGGDRLIELGCVEIVNRIPTGREFHRYLNPERDIHPDAVAVHGLTRRFPEGQAALQGCGRRVPGLHRRCAAGCAQRHLRSRLRQCRARARVAAAAHVRPHRRHAGAGAAAPSGRPQQLWMRCASATASICPSAPSTAPCSIPCCWPASTSSCWANARPRWASTARAPRTATRRRTRPRPSSAPLPLASRVVRGSGSRPSRVRQNIGRRRPLVALSWRAPSSPAHA